MNESKTSISKKCSLETGVTERVAHGVLWLDWPITSSARDRALRWAVSKRLLNPDARARRLSTRSKQVFIYVIRVFDFVKIGRASDVTSRLASIQTSLPVEVELIALFKGVSSDEEQLHARFATSHVRGEWFRLSDDELRKGLSDKPAVWMKPS